MIKHNRMKILNIINFLILTIKNNIRFFTVYLYFKNNLKKLIRTKNKKISFVCDNRTNNQLMVIFYSLLILQDFLLISTMLTI